MSLANKSREIALTSLCSLSDAYMTVTNLAEKQDDHVEIMARFALKVIKLASETWIDPSDPSLGKIQVRAGFHSGPVVAQVIGTRNPRYSVIGDTVNVASRMESNSQAGMVQCSAHSAKLLRQRKMNDLTLIPRGTMSIKGKGRMETFFVRHSADKSEYDVTEHSEYSL